MACSYEDGYEDARSRRDRLCDGDDYEDGYAAGLRVNRRLAEERAEQERLEAEAYEQMRYEDEMRRQYEEEARAQYEAECAAAAEAEAQGCGAEPKE